MYAPGRSGGRARVSVPPPHSLRFPPCCRPPPPDRAEMPAEPTRRQSLWGRPCRVRSPGAEPRPLEGEAQSRVRKVSGDISLNKFSGDLDFLREQTTPDYALGTKSPKEIPMALAIC